MPKPDCITQSGFCVVFHGGEECLASSCRGSFADPESDDKLDCQDMAIPRKPVADDQDDPPVHLLLNIKPIEMRKRG